MNLKKQIAVIVLALTATTSPIWSQDRQSPQLPTSHPTIEGVWRETRMGVNCDDPNQHGPPFPAIMTFNQGGTCTGYAVPPGGDPGQGTEYGVWQREPGSHNYSYRTVSYGYTAEGDYEGRAEITNTLHLTSANSFESTATIQIFDADDNLVFTACARRTGTRFE